MGIKFEKLNKDSLIIIIRNIKNNLDNGKILIGFKLTKEKYGNSFTYYWKDKT